MANPRTIGRKRPRPAKKGDWASFIRELPAEYADFRLEDGRTFGEVMGADILGSPSGTDGGEPMTPEFHEKLREGNYDLAGIVRENPDRFAPPRGKLKTRPASPPPGQEEAGGIFDRDSEVPVVVAVEEARLAASDLNDPTPPLGKVNLQAGADQETEDKSGTLSAGSSLAEAQRKKQEAMTGWMKSATFDMDVPGGWKELPRLPDGRIDRGALEPKRIYHVRGEDDTRTAWRWNESKRGFKPIRSKMDVAFSIDGMHELIGVQVKRASDGRPIYNMEQDRINAIIWGTDAVFEVADNPDADDSGRLQDWVNASYASAKVFEHTATIEKLAKEYGVKPKLVKAIMYREQAGGGLQPSLDTLRLSDTISPMGINPDKWSGLGIDRDAVSKSEDNIRAAIILIRRIQDRLVDPTPEKIATLYNGLMMENVNNYGEMVGRYYKDEPWLDWDPLKEEENLTTSP